MSKSNLIKTERHFICLFRSSAQSPPSHAVSALKIFPKTSKYQFHQQSVCAKDLLQNRTTLRAVKGFSPALPPPRCSWLWWVHLRCWIIYLPGSFPGPGPLVSHTAHAPLCAWTPLWTKPTTSVRGKAEAQLCGQTALRMAEQGWDYASFGSSCPTLSQLASCPQTPPVCPTPHPTACSIPLA